jgi:hypothetical protein
MTVPAEPAAIAPAVSGDLLSLIGSLYACLSVIIVFQMFALQAWFSGAIELDRLSFEIDERAMTDSLERGQAIARMLDHKRRYPIIQVIGLSGATAAICVLAILLGVQVHTIGYAYTVSPAAILVVTSFGVTIAITVRGLATLSDAADRLK